MFCSSVVIASFIAVTSSCGGARAPEATGVLTDADVLADAEPVSYDAVDAVTGEKVSMADLRGRPAIIASWATWCVPCRKELPALERLHRAQGDDGVRVVIVNLDSGGDDDAVAEFVDRFGLTMTQWRDADDRFTPVFKGLGIPMSALVDRDGVIVERWYGALDPDDPTVADALRDVMITPG